MDFRIDLHVFGGLTYTELYVITRFTTECIILRDGIIDNEKT